MATLMGGGLPPELLYDDEKQGRVSLSDFMRQWKDSDPSAMYIAQLTDYLVNLVSIGKMKPEEAGDIMKVAHNWAQFPIDPSLWKIEGIPDYNYNTVMATIGPTVKANYQAYLAGLDETVKKLQTQVMTPQGQIAVNDAINRGLITRQEAYDNNPYWKYYSQVQAKRTYEEARPQHDLNLKYAELQGRAADLGIDIKPFATETPDKDIYNRLQAMVTQAESQKQAVAQGQAAGVENIANKQAGYGQPQSPAVQQMQKWAQTINPATGTYFTEDEARQKVNAVQQTTQAWTPSSEAMASLIQKAKGLGMDVSGMTPYNAQPGVVEALNNQITSLENQQKQSRSNLLAKQYPDIFKTWQTEFGKGYGGTGLPEANPIATQLRAGSGGPPAGYEKGFYDWANATATEDNPLTPAQIAFQQARTSQEAQRWRDYGQIYGLYNSYLSKLTNPEDYKTLDQWINENPQVKTAWALEQERKQVKTPHAVYMR